MELTELDFIQDWEEGRLNLNIPQDADYHEGCKYGRLSFQAYLYYLLHSEYLGGDLQHITSSLEDLPDSEAKWGFRVGFYSAVEDQLRRSIVAMHQLHTLHRLNARLDNINHQASKTASEIKAVQAEIDRIAGNIEQLEGAEL